MAFGIELRNSANVLTWSSDSLPLINLVGIVNVAAGASGSIAGYSGCTAFAAVNEAGPADPGTGQYYGHIKLPHRVAIIGGTLYYQPAYGTAAVNGITYQGAASTIYIMSGFSPFSVPAATGWGFEIRNSANTVTFNSNIPTLMLSESGTATIPCYNTKLSNNTQYRMITVTLSKSYTTNPLIVVKVGGVSAGYFIPIAFGGRTANTFTVLIEGNSAISSISLSYRVYAIPKDIPSFTVTDRYALACIDSSGGVISLLDGNTVNTAYGCNIASTPNMSTTPTLANYGTIGDWDSWLILNAAGACGLYYWALPYSDGVMSTGAAAWTNISGVWGWWNNADLNIKAYYTNSGLSSPGGMAWKQSQILQKF